MAYTKIKAIDFNLEQHFNNLRHDPRFHIGLGDVRLTMAQQDEIVELFNELKKEIDAIKTKA